MRGSNQQAAQMNHPARTLGRSRWGGAQAKCRVTTEGQAGHSSWQVPRPAAQRLGIRPCRQVAAARAGAPHRTRYTLHAFHSFCAKSAKGDCLLTLNALQAGPTAQVRRHEGGSTSENRSTSDAHQRASHGPNAIAQLCTCRSSHAAPPGTGTGAGTAYVDTMETAGTTTGTEITCGVETAYPDI